MKPTIACLLCLLLSSQTALAQDAPAATYRSQAEILASSPSGDWRTPDPANLLLMDLPAGRVIIELAPAFAPRHVDNIRTMAREHFWDNTSIYRVQDNFVVQFGDPDAKDPAKAKALGSAKRHLPAEFQRAAAGLTFTALPDADGWAPQAGFVDGFPVAEDPATGKAWLVHCYGTVGAGRENPDDSSIGDELYAIIGHAPRRLDANLSVVGRVLQGMELLSAVRRGTGPRGGYKTPAERTPIHSIRLASELPESERPKLQVLRTDSATFQEYVASQRLRTDAFYKRPAGRVEVCSISAPVR
ncbi:MAG: peptidylprolyl isomerase [Steroidobacteraceae bacterium]